MNLTIHRGTNQIGGCITEYEIDGWKLFVDFGEQLPGSPVTAEPIKIEGLNCGDTSRSALLITHYHGDHVGKITDADPSIPVFMGHIAHDIFCKLQRRLTYIKGEPGEKAKEVLERCKNVRTFLDGEQISFGPFIIEPVKMDHSAYDAYGFIIENKDNPDDIVFHTGDFRFHGFFGEEYWHKITNLPPVKAIVCEATNIENEKEIVSEQTIENQYFQNFCTYKYNVVFVSSTNIDRIFSIYRAAYQAGRPLLVDEYQFDILRSVIGENDWSLNDDQWLTLEEDDGEVQIFPDEGRYEFNHGTPYVLKLDRSFHKHPEFFIPRKLRKLISDKGFVLLARSTPQFTRLIDSFPKEHTKKYLSMWDGYVDPANPAYNEKLANALGDDYKQIHTSGHASVLTLRELFMHVDAEMIIPMHTANPEKFLKEFPQNEWQIRLINDGETLPLNEI